MNIKSFCHLAPLRTLVILIQFILCTEEYSKHIDTMIPPYIAESKLKKYHW